ncbi:cullin family protein [Oesophagostomum dentatum]|uniref:Cullin family protein n=1 Tax=Oesophagostomum dentatum TaxID=61180 RepID=A0A0B1RVL8_OESDE|nr:cullin family protein [Oesophagostomum dentatum]
MSESEVDQQLSKAIVIFRYIEDKDVFQKQACGYEFTSKLSRMFTDIGLSSELADKFNKPSITEFEKYYIGAHNGRKLTWLFNMSHGELRFTYLDKPYLVSMSVHQMSVILCFQDKDTVSVRPLFSI